MLVSGCGLLTPALPASEVLFPGGPGGPGDPVGPVGP